MPEAPTVLLGPQPEQFEAVQQDQQPCALRGHGGVLFRARTAINDCYSFHGMEEVDGSNPSRSTKPFKHLPSLTGRGGSHRSPSGVRNPLLRRQP